MAKLYARLLSDRGKSKVYRAGESFIEIELTCGGHFATIAWCHETRDIGIYGKGKKPIKVFSPNELGHFD